MKAILKQQQFILLSLVIVLTCQSSAGENLPVFVTAIQTADEVPTRKKYAAFISLLYETTLKEVARLDDLPFDERREQAYIAALEIHGWLEEREAIETHAVAMLTGSDVLELRIGSANLLAHAGHLRPGTIEALNALFSSGTLPQDLATYIYTNREFYLDDDQLVFSDGFVLSVYQDYCDILDQPDAAISYKQMLAIMDMSATIVEAYWPREAGKQALGNLVRLYDLVENDSLKAGVVSGAISGLVTESTDTGKAGDLIVEVVKHLLEQYSRLDRAEDYSTQLRHLDGLLLIAVRDQLSNEARRLITTAVEQEPDPVKKALLSAATYRGDDAGVHAGVIQIFKEAGAGSDARRAALDYFDLKRKKDVVTMLVEAIADPSFLEHTTAYDGADDADKPFPNSHSLHLTYVLRRIVGGGFEISDPQETQSAVMAWWQEHKDDPAYESPTPKEEKGVGSK